jgi:hypothetical protein
MPLDQEFGEVKAELRALSNAVRDGFAELKEDRVDKEVRLRAVERWQGIVTGAMKFITLIGMPTAAILVVVH